jgi:hypothetical protein
MATSIGRVAARLQVTRSGLITQLLGEPISELEKLVDLLPADASAATPESIKRLRGASVEFIERAVRDALSVSAELDPSPKLPL